MIRVDEQQFIDYETKNLDYKVQARELLCKTLGYEPPIRASVLSELILRDSMKRYETGELSQENYEWHIDFTVGIVKGAMIEMMPSFNC